MKMSIAGDDLQAYIIAQLNAFFPDKHKVSRSDMAGNFDIALQRLENCFSKINKKYFKENGSAVFNHLNADQYAMLLYFLANTLYRDNRDVNMCAKIFHLNRYLHGLDAFYEVELPDIFLFIHPLGTVLGRATYSDYLLVYQRCGVGSHNDIFPELKEYVSLHPGSSILGNCVIEDNCKISAGSTIMDMSLEKNSVYIGNTINFVIKKSLKKNNVWL